MTFLMVSFHHLLRFVISVIEVSPLWVYLICFKECPPLQLGWWVCRCILLVCVREGFLVFWDLSDMS